MGAERPANTYAAGVLLSEGGYRRGALDIARDFVREQSMGEWGDEVEERDAQKLADLLNGYLRAPSGHIIAPLTHGGHDCLCEVGTEDWCRAFRCPRITPKGREALSEKEG